jgi:putative ABC transport system permease protein
MYAPDVRIASRDYFNTMAIQIVQGRGFRETDTSATVPVVVISETMARARFPGRSAVGEYLYGGPQNRTWQIVGVARDVRQRGNDQAPEPQLYVDYRQWPLPTDDIAPYHVVRTSTDPYAILPLVRSVVRRIDPEATLERVGTMDELVQASLGRPRLYAVLLGIFAGVAVTLAAIGIYGVMAYTVAQSTRDIGLRMAIGAERRSILALVLGRGMMLALIGIGVGALLSLGMTRSLQGLLFGLTSFDPATLVGVAALFAMVAALASYVPARRAIRVDPLVALRQD